MGYSKNQQLTNQKISAANKGRKPSPLAIKNSLEARKDQIGEKHHSWSGTNCIDNIQPLCRSCNSSKQTKTINYIYQLTKSPWVRL